jgi:hypothetical protein
MEDETLVVIHAMKLRSQFYWRNKGMNKEYDVDAIVQEVENAVLAGKCRSATEEEKMLVRIGALENIVHSYKESIANSVAQKVG